MGSGKTEICGMLGKDFGYSIISTGRILAELVGAPPVPKTARKEFCDLAEKFISSPGGPDKLASTIYSIISSQSEKPFAIDGLRNVPTFDALRKKLKGDLALIYVDAMIDNAYGFLRKRESAKISLREFAELVHHPVERGVEDFADPANIVVYNHGTKESYLQKVREFFTGELT